MKKSQRIKRKALGTILHHTLGIMSACTMQIGDILRGESGTPAYQTSPLRGALTAKEFRLLDKRIKTIRQAQEEIRIIALHLERNP